MCSVLWWFLLHRKWLHHDYFSFIYAECSYTLECEDLTFADYMSTPEIYWLFLACLFHTIIWFLGLKIADVVKDGGSPSSAFTCFSTTKVIQLSRTKNIQAKKKALLSLPSSIPLFTPFTVHQNAFCHQKPGQHTVVDRGGIWGEEEGLHTLIMTKTLKKCADMCISTLPLTSRPKF